MSADPVLPTALAVLGPTGSGKSGLAMQIARRIPAEIISVDSAQVYRGLDIGTAKPSRAEREEVPHHLIDIRDPEDVYSAGEFRRDALELIPQILSRGRLPLLVGGTMLYFRALFRGMAELPRADATLRAGIESRATQEGWPALHAELARGDPRAAATIAPHDAQRIQRALELLALTGRPRHELWDEDSTPPAPCHWQIVILEPPSREWLHQRLAERLQVMLDQGLVNEVRGLLERGTLDDARPALRMVGYRQLIGHCRGAESLEEATARVLQATRQLARRQMTWLRSSVLLPEGAQTLKIRVDDVQDRERLWSALIQPGAAS